MAPNKFERGITLSGSLIAAGLILQSVATLWVHPLAFMSFLILGAPLVAIGAVVFLATLFIRE